MNKFITQEVICPKRGKRLAENQEEIYRIECIKWLVEKLGIDVDYICLDRPIARMGSKGQNTLKPDIAILTSKEPPSGQKIDIDSVIGIVENKVYKKDKNKAIIDQLLPAMRFCSHSIKFGIYWDESSRIAFNGNLQKIGLSDVINIFKSNTVTDEKTIDELLVVKHGNDIWATLENELRSRTGTGKLTQDKAVELIKIIITKYYDEKINKHNIKFYKLLGEESKDLAKRIKDLHKEATTHYELRAKSNEVNKLVNPIALKDSEIEACVEVIQEYCLSKTDAQVIQDFYMKFAPNFVKKDFDQYYTPQTITKFMTDVVAMNTKTKIIDPCCGTADFLIYGFSKLRKIHDEAHRHVAGWDSDSNIALLAQINMILIGDGRSNIKETDSLEDYETDNGKYTTVLTNPPFGDKTKHKGKNASKYELAEYNEKQKKFEVKSGKAFIEKDLNLLQEKGVLGIIVPTGYLNNSTDKPLREFILERSVILGVIQLPAGVFTKSGAGVETSILYVRKKEANEKSKNYDFFVAAAEKIGFETGTKKYKPIYLREETSGNYITDENNQKIFFNDLDKITIQFKSFATDKNITEIENIGNNADKEYYDTANTAEILDDEYLRIIPKMHLTGDSFWLKTIERIRKNGDSFTLTDINAKVEQSTPNRKIDDETKYKYIVTADIKKDTILEIKEGRGWELPDRIKIEDIKTNDILLAEMAGQGKTYGMIYSCYPKIMASNGFYRIRIDDEKQRLSFLHFLSTKEFENQIKSLTTGSIMATIDEDILLTKLVVPMLNSVELKKVKQMIEEREKYLEFQQNF